MQREACTAFLHWALPRLGLRWAGYRKVRGTVCKRLNRRLRTLGLTDLEAYRRHLAADPREWDALAACCRIPISRFFRDRGVFAALGDHVLPALCGRAEASGRARLRAWSAGCASGEEPYSLALLWRESLAPRFPGLALELLASDVEPRMLQRAARACYPAGALRDLPAGWRPRHFDCRDGLYCLKGARRAEVELLCQDLTTAMPEGPFDLILCRNLAFTYFATARQAAVLRGLTARLCDGGALVIGAHEILPAVDQPLPPWPDAPHCHRKPG